MGGINKSMKTLIIIPAILLTACSFIMPVQYDPAGGAAKFNLFKTKAVAGNSTIQLINEPLILMESEVIQVTAADANRLHIVASILEINGITLRNMLINIIASPRAGIA